MYKIFVKNKGESVAHIGRGRCEDVGVLGVRIFLRMKLWVLAHQHYDSGGGAVYKVGS